MIHLPCENSILPKIPCSGEFSKLMNTKPRMKVITTNIWKNPLVFSFWSSVWMTHWTRRSRDRNTAMTMTDHSSGVNMVGRGWWARRQEARRR